MNFSQFRSKLMPLVQQYHQHYHSDNEHGMEAVHEEISELMSDFGQSSSTSGPDKKMGLELCRKQLDFMDEEFVESMFESASKKTFKQFMGEASDMEKKYAIDNLQEQNWVKDGGTFYVDLGGKACVIGYEPDTGYVKIARYDNAPGVGVFVGYNDERSHYQKKFFGDDLNKAKQFVVSLGFPKPPAEVTLGKLRSMNR